VLAVTQARKRTETKKLRRKLKMEYSRSYRQSQKDHNTFLSEELDKAKVVGRWVHVLCRLRLSPFGNGSLSEASDDFQWKLPQRRDFPHRTERVALQRARLCRTVSLFGLRR
jgi:hypothetical protein